MHHPRSPFLRLIVSTRFWIVAYVAMIVLICGCFIYFKNWAAEVYSSSTAQSAWDAWREDVKNAPKDVPVQRREPKSEQPPATILLTDYFFVCLGIALLLSSVLFAVFMFIIRGVLLSPGQINE